MDRYPEYDFDNDFAQKFHTRSTMNYPHLKHDLGMCGNCIKWNLCKKAGFSELDWCPGFELKIKVEPIIQEVVKQEVEDGS